MFRVYPCQRLAEPRKVKISRSHNCPVDESWNVDWRTILFCPAARGELELRRGRILVARDHFSTALALASNPTERTFLAKRVKACGVT